MCVDVVDAVFGQCLGPAAVGQSATVLVQCPSYYHLRIRSAAVYKSASGCPSTPTSDACLHSNISDVVDTTCLRNESSCQLTVPAPTSPLHCNLPTYAGDYFIIIDYRCQPGSTATTMFKLGGLIITSQRNVVYSDLDTGPISSAQSNPQMLNPNHLTQPMILPTRPQPNPRLRSRWIEFATKIVYRSVLKALQLSAHAPNHVTCK